MRTIARSLAGAIAGILILGSAASAETAGRCTHDSWNVDGQPLVAAICVPAVRSPRVDVSETFTRNGTSVNRSLALDVLSGSDVTRAIDDVDLAAVGSSKQLHLTILYRAGTASVEHALLLPGALVLK
jgi:hypothetical protein